MTERYRDRWLLVVDKPPGLPTQAPRGGGDNLYDRLRAREAYVGLHHRLDAAASGLVLVTLDPSANRDIALAFRTHAVERTYLAVACGEVEPGVWDRPIDGEPACTVVEVAGRLGGRTLLRLRPRTGRKHQLRVHAAFAGAPLLGDRTYGGDPFARLALHAAALALDHPVTGARVAVESELPREIPWAHS